MIGSKRVLAAIMGVIGFGSSFAFARDMAKDIEEGKSLHNEAEIIMSDESNEDTSSTEKCMALLKPYVDSSSVACAYYGSAITLKAGVVSRTDPIKSLDLLEEGSSYIDKAVSMDKSNLELHILRLTNGLEVSDSSPYKRYSVIKEDVDFLTKDEVLESLDDETKSLVYMDSALFRIRQGLMDEGLELLEEAADCGKGGMFEEKINQLLVKYEE